MGERDKPREEAERIREGTDLIGLVATRLARRLGRHVHLDDLKALGREALLSIVKTYDPSRGKFRTYAILKLRWAMLDGIRRETHGRTAAARIQALVASERFGAALSAVPSDNEPVLSEDGYRERLRVLLEGHAAALAVGLIASVGDMALVPDAADGPEESASRRQLATVLHRAVRDLPERERALIERHYFEGEQFDAIARDLGISKSWASRLHAQAIETLGKVLCTFWSSSG